MAGVASPDLLLGNQANINLKPPDPNVLQKAQDKQKVDSTIHDAVDFMNGKTGAPVIDISSAGSQDIVVLDGNNKPVKKNIKVGVPATAMLSFLDTQAQGGSTEAKDFHDTLAPKTKNSLELFNEQVLPTDPLYDKIFEQRFRIEIELRSDPNNPNSLRADGTPKDKAEILTELKADLKNQTEIVLEPLNSDEADALQTQSRIEANAITAANIAIIDRQLARTLIEIAAKKGNKTDIGSAVCETILQNATSTPEQKVFALDMMMALANRERIALRDSTSDTAIKRRKELRLKMEEWHAIKFDTTNPLPTHLNMIGTLSQQLGASDYLMERYKDKYRDPAGKYQEDMAKDPLIALSSFIEASVTNTGARQSLLENYEQFILKDKVAGMAKITLNSTQAEKAAWAEAEKASKEEADVIKSMFRKENFKGMAKQTLLSILMGILFKVGSMLAHPEKTFGGQQQQGMPQG